MAANTSGAQPQLPTFQQQPPPGTPLPHPQLADMDKIHRVVASGKLTDMLARIAGKVKL